jgi:ubiquitin thioesterase OTU1
LQTHSGNPHPGTPRNPNPPATTTRVQSTSSFLKTMTPALKLRLRTRGGVVPLELPADASFPALRAAVAVTAALRPASVVVRAGFPPRALDLDAAGRVSALLQSGEVLAVQGEPDGAAVASASASAPPTFVDASPQTVPAPKATPAVAERGTAGELAGRSGQGESIAEMGSVVERVVPDDNSCLFRAVAGIVYNDQSSDAAALRRICSEAIAQDPLFYSDDMLQKPNHEYCAWIQRPTAWGGPIELAILSAHFKIELAAFDIRSMRPQRYGEGQHPQVGFLIYDGLHYNYLCLSIAASIPDITQFDAKDEVVYEKVRDVVQRRHDKGDFTNTHSFKVRCAQCGTVVVGERGAQAHGEQTGHSSFEEVKK